MTRAVRLLVGLVVLASLSACRTPDRPRDQALVTLGLGAHDIDLFGSGERLHPTASVEVRMAPVLGRVRPTVGAVAAGRGSYYAYSGLMFDIPLTRNLHLCPSSAVGYYERGRGKDLGLELEFRSGVELAYVRPDGQRFGLQLTHMSNANLGHSNRGVESIMLLYSVPVPALVRSARSVQ